MSLGLILGGWFWFILYVSVFLWFGFFFVMGGVLFVFVVVWLGLFVGLVFMFVGLGVAWFWFFFCCCLWICLVSWWGFFVSLHFIEKTSLGKDYVVFACDKVC